MTATKKIKGGDIVLKEAPILKGPSQITGPVCVGCLEVNKSFKLLLLFTPT